MPTDQEQDTQAAVDRIAKEYGVSVDELLAMAQEHGITDASQLEQYAAAGKQYGLNPMQFMAGRGVGQQQDPGTNWSDLLSGVDPRVARTAVSAGSEQANAYPELGTTAAQSLADLSAGRSASTRGEPGTGVTALPRALWDAASHQDVSYTPEGARQTKWTPGGRDPDAMLPTWAPAAMGGLQMLGSGGLNLGGLARASLANGAYGSSTGLGVARPDQSRVGDQVYNTNPGLMQLAKQYGIRVGGYSDPTKLVDTMRSSIDARKDAMTQSGQYTPEQVEQWGNDELSRFNGMLGVEGGVDGLAQQQRDDTVKAVAGTQPGQGTVNEAYNAGAVANAVTPARIAAQQVKMFEGVPGALKGTLRGAGNAAKGAWDWAKRTGPAAAVTPAAPARSWGSTLKAGGGTALRGLGGIAGMAMSMPTYLQAMRNDMDLYDTATDPTGQGGFAHDAATAGTGATSLGMQMVGGEYAIPRAIVNGAAGGRGAMAGTEFAKQLALRTPGGAVPNGPQTLLQRGGNLIRGAGNALKSPFTAGVRALGAARAAGGLGTATAAAKGLGGFARGAAPAAMLGSWAVDAGANASAATRNLANFSGGGDETVRAENRALADNSGWTDGSAGGIAKGIAGAVFRPTTATREIAGAVDQNREMIRGNEDAAAEMASKQQIAPIQRLQKYRAQAAAAGQDTSAIDKQLQTVSRQISAGPANQTWQDVAKWQQGGWFSDRSQLPFKEQYAKMDAATRARADEIISGVSAGTVDPERARVALGLPAMQEWSSADMRDPNKAAANQRWVVNQADVGTNRANPQWQISGQWQNPNTAKPQIAAKPAATPAARPPVQQPAPAKPTMQAPAQQPAPPRPAAIQPRLAPKQPAWMPAYGAE